MQSGVCKTFVSKRIMSSSSKVLNERAYVADPVRRVVLSLARGHQLQGCIAVAFIPISTDLDASLRTCFAALPGSALAKRNTSGSACSSQLRTLPQTAYFAP